MMIKIKRILPVIFGLIMSQVISGQILKPGFDKEEYIEMLKINQKAHIALNKWVAEKFVPASTP